MSRHAAELSVLLVDDLYGELTSRLFEVLLRYGRLSIPAIQFHTQLKLEVVKHGLSVLVQQHLVLWYSSAEDNATVFEANTEATYLLVRSGKCIEITEKRMGEFAGAVVSNLLLLGHARVGDLVQAYGVSHNREHKGQPNNGYGFPTKPLQNGTVQRDHQAEDHNVSLESLHSTLGDLLKAGFLRQVNESHFRSDADNRTEADRMVKPPAEYKAKSKKESDAQRERAIREKLHEWKYGTERERKAINSLAKGKKRMLEDPESTRAEKRRRLYLPLTKQVVGSTGEVYQPNWGDTGYLDNNMILRVNHAKFAVIMRNKCLVRLADQSFSSSTSKVYTKVLGALEPGLWDCKEEPDPTDEKGEEIDFGSLNQVSTDEIVATIKDSSDLANALGEGENGKASLTRFDHPKKRRKKEFDTEDEVMVDGDASPDEGEDDSEPNDNISELLSDSEDTVGEADYGPIASNRAPDPHRNTIRSHLLLLAQHPHHFLHHFPRTRIQSESWAVHFPPLVKTLTHHTLLQTITSRHGLPAARLTRMLSQKGKVDEKTMCQTSLIGQKDMRSYLTTLHKEGMIEVQEVPRDNARKAERTSFLWFFDIDRCRLKVLEETYKTMGRFLQRARVEGNKVKGTVEKASRSDVVGREKELLGSQEMKALEDWRDVEERIWGEIGRLDNLVAVLRDF